MPRAKLVNTKPRGKMSSYAFFVQTCREEHRKNFPNENVVLSDFSKKCSDRWKRMNDHEKAAFNELASKDKIRYDSEMTAYNKMAMIGEDGSSVGRIRERRPRGSRMKRKKKDPNAPKRPLSAFFLFSASERKQVKSEFPSYSVGEVARELGKRWATTPADARSKYEELSKKDNLRYAEEMKRYRSGNSVLNEDDDDDSEDGEDMDDE